MSTHSATISVFDVCPNYREALEREPIFSGTTYEYIEKYGEAQK